MLLVGRQEGHPACKNRVVGCWRSYLSGARCRLAYSPADVTASFFSKIQIAFTFLVPAHLGSPLNVCVCVRVRVRVRVCVCCNMYVTVCRVSVRLSVCLSVTQLALTSCWTWSPSWTVLTWRWFIRCRSPLTSRALHTPSRRLVDIVHVTHTHTPV